MVGVFAGVLFSTAVFSQPGLLYQKDGVAPGDHFGESVAIAGDLNGDGRADFIVRGDSVYVYSGADGSPLYQKRWGSAAGIGDITGDGKADFIVGDPSTTGPGGLHGAGSFYVYSGATGDLLYQKNGTIFHGGLGASVAGMGDINGDGKADFIVGAPYAETPCGSYCGGSVYVYSGADGSLLYQKERSTIYEYFGSSVDGAGDVNSDGKPDFIVAAPGAPSGGSTFVYSGADGSLIFRKDRMGSSVAGAGDVNGDGKSDFIIGAHAADPGGVILAGSAYLYSGADGTLIFRKDGRAEYDLFGSSVAGTGDVNGDGRTDFIMGAPNADPAGLVDAGSAFVHSLPSSAMPPVLEPIADQSVTVGYSLEVSLSAAGDDSSILILSVSPLPAGANVADSLNGRGYFFWTPTLSQTGVYLMRFIASNGTFADTQNVTLTVTADTFLSELQSFHRKSGGNPADNFGYSVSGAGDINGDGQLDFIVASPFIGNSDPGSVLVYSGANGSMLYRKNGGAWDYFGATAAGISDVNGDAKADFMVASSTSAFVYSGSDGSLLYQKNGAENYDYPGLSVAAAGDVNGDGRSDFIVGEYYADPDGHTDASSAFLYSGADGSLLFQKNGVTAGDRLGTSAAGFGDINGDGRVDFIVGASGTNNFTGAAYAYSGATGSLIYQLNGETVGDRLGSSLGIVGDVNGDGTDDFILGAPAADPGQLVQAGSAFVYSGGNGALLFRKNGATPYDRFGSSVAGTGDINGDGKADFIVGAPTADHGGLQTAGSAFLYSGATGALLFQIDGSVSRDSLGTSVAGVGDINEDGKPDFIVGVPGAANSSGIVYIFGLCAAKGDFNGDGVLTALDVVASLNCTFLVQGDYNLCFADVNCDGALRPADIVLELLAVFVNQPFPCL